MQKLIFDIETISPDFETLPDDLREHLIEKFSQEYPGKSRDEIIQLIDEKLALLPQLSQILAISFYNPDTKRGAVYFWVNDEIESWTEEMIEYKSFKSEKEIIEKFWEIIPNYQEIITFNGNRFDIPFILFRSLVHRIRPTMSLLDKEYHIDLYEKLSFNNRISRISLKLLSLGLNINDPKKNFDGRKLKDLIKAGDYKSIVKYALGDVLTTAEIYNLWTNYLRFF